MNISQLIDIVGVGLAILVATWAGWILLYWPRVKARCDKYPFYALRDKVIWALVHGSKDSEMETLYETVNTVTKDLRYFGIKFVSRSVALYCDEFVAHEVLSPEELRKKYSATLCDGELAKLNREFITLLLRTARSNSIMAFVVTAPGLHRIFFTAHFFGAVLRFAKRHPRYAQRIKTVYVCAELQYVLQHA